MINQLPGFDQSDPSRSGGQGSTACPLTIACWAPKVPSLQSSSGLWIRRCTATDLDQISSFSAPSEQHSEFIQYGGIAVSPVPS